MLAVCSDGFPAWFLQLDKEAVRRGGAGIRAGMFLRVEPAGLPCRQFHIDLPASCPETAGEGAQSDHNAVRVGMGAGPVSGAVAVLEDADTVVFENEPVVLRIHCNGIGHGKPLGKFYMGRTYHYGTPVS